MSLSGHEYHIGYAPGCERCPFRNFYEMLQLNKQYRVKIEQLTKELDNIKKDVPKNE